MKEPIAISPATLVDVAAIVLLVNEAYRGDTSRAGWTTEADLLDGIRIDQPSLNQLMADKRSTILKGTLPDGTLAGVVHLEQQETAMYLGMLTVKPSLQQSGIGKRLMHAGENLAREKGCTRMVMTVISVRHELIAWYQSKGYVPTGIKKPFPQDPRFGIPKQPLEFIVMEKQLPTDALPTW